MEYTPLIKEDEIAEAFDSFSGKMTKGTTPFLSYLAYRRYPEKEKKRCVCWNKSLGIWSFFDKAEKLYWGPVGVQDSSTSSQDTSKPPRLIITCLIDFPCEGINRKVNGLFVMDDDENIYVTHKGNVGGGAKGIGRSSFRNSDQYQKFDIINVIWPDGKETETICIGKLDDALPRKVSNFVKDVRRFKDDIKEKRDGRPL
ncbi:hypothetical protein EO98_03580 [Methanosarcina sp. 2.H.T.1A.6]|uniref:hypothetical protein n=1 Tax=unclassified Methanosarcina TaxID=2644672 RepID=UPI00062299F2|nr:MULTISPECIES: hypothetical protein [unclassified Methanosarcina]KKG11165.1 hypothetical protein EO97_10890 [Methanosarcina sp. 2.H.T.1A.15]KKG18468.1 hypothetical protein EO94_04635 [Methanosarcina sp. 2.H.T.1A.3]KKG20669.1 hypothetical protein EO98_03580 [Methanosarcina sp. 2.H.T.1A.6]KKG23229.1 hypothetical protein EO96_02110 [Methanosarcina sp. 2.H.T.1A.8]